jgi:hypothetical protein
MLLFTLASTRKNGAAIDEIFDNEVFETFSDDAVKAAKQLLLSSIIDNKVVCNLPWLLEDDKDEEENNFNRFCLNPILKEVSSSEELFEKLELTSDDIV